MVSEKETKTSRIMRLKDTIINKYESELIEMERLNNDLVNQVQELTNELEIERNVSEVQTSFRDHLISEMSENTTWHLNAILSAETECFLLRDKIEKYEDMLETILNAIRNEDLTVQNIYWVTYQVAHDYRLLKENGNTTEQRKEQ